jgi:WD40 repeat protein
VLVAGESLVHVLDAATGRPLNPAGQEGAVFSLAFSADGRQVISAGQGGQVCFWDAATGRLEREVHSGYNGIGMTACISEGRPRVVEALPFGEKLAYFRAWDVATGKERCRLGPWALDVLLYDAVSPDGSCMAVACKDGASALLDLSTGRKMREVSDFHSDGAIHGSFSHDGRQLAVSRQGGPIRVLDPRTGKEIRRLGGEVEGSFPQAVFSPDGGRLAALVHIQGRVNLPFDTGISQHLRVWDLATGRELSRWKIETAYQPVLAFSPDGRLLALADFEGVILLWDAATGKNLRRFTGHTGWVRALAFSPDGRTLASGGRDTTVLLWDVSDLAKR